MNDEESAELARYHEKVKRNSELYESESYSIKADWWYVAAHLSTINSFMSVVAHNKKIQWKTTRGFNSVFFDGSLVDEDSQFNDTPIITAILTGANREALITITYIKHDNIRDEVKFLREELEQFAKLAASFHRGDSSVRFRELLDDYYGQRREGGNPSLRQMADMYHVNYASLRQFKMRYDRQRKADASVD